MDIDNDEELENVASFVITWLTGQNLREESGDQSTSDSIMFETVSEEEIGGAGEITHENDAMFSRVRQVFLYQSSREELQHYRSTHAQLLESKEKNGQEEEVTMSDLESMSKTDTNISYCSTWFLNTSLSSSQTQPSSTDSEIYKLSSSNESLTVNHNQDDCLYCLKTKEQSPTLNKNESDLRQQNGVSNENSNEREDVLNNILLQACILDINDRPMTAFVAQIVSQMIPQLFNNPREVEVIRHFIRYKIKKTIEEINERLRELSRQQNDIMRTLENEDLYDEESGNEVDNNGENLYIRSQSSITSELQERSNVEENQPLVSSNSTSEGDDIYASNDTQVDENSEITPESLNKPMLCNENSNSTKKLIPEDDIMVDEMYGLNNGRTVRVLEIINKMVGMSLTDRQNILINHKDELSEEEYNEVLHFMQSAKDLSYKKYSFWKKILTCSYFRHDK